MRRKGRIETWKDDQGYGFISPTDGGGDVFAHVHAFVDRQRRPAAGDAVSFELGRDERGRPRAEAIEFAGSAPGFRPPTMRKLRPLAIPIGFLTVAAGSAAAGKIPYVVVGLYLVMSIATFIAYAVDKSAAQRGRWRTKEQTLHAMSLLGGWPGALAAQRLIRHKSSKPSFQAVFWGTVLLNVGLFFWLFTPDGAAAFRQFLGSL